jgi:WD40 repeat protein
VNAVAALGMPRVASGDALGLVRVWDLHHPGSPVELGSHNGSVTAVAMLGDGRVVSAGSFDGRVCVWHPHTPGQPLIEIRRDVNSLAADAHDGGTSQLAMGHPRGVSSWTIPPSVTVNAR